MVHFFITFYKVVQKNNINFFPRENKDMLNAVRNRASGFKIVGKMLFYVFCFFFFKIWAVGFAFGLFWNQPMLAIPSMARTLCLPTWMVDFYGKLVGKDSSLMDGLGYGM